MAVSVILTLDNIKIRGFEPATFPGSLACIPGCCCCCGFVVMRFCAAAMGTLICDVGVVIVTVRF